MRACSFEGLEAFGNAVIPISGMSLHLLKRDLKNSHSGYILCYLLREWKSQSESPRPLVGI